MFTGIHEVDWASLRHADGSAEDVPGVLRGLISADPAERGTALDELYGSLHHQGRVYDATLACVPFLLRLVAHEGVPERAGLVDLLVSIGDGERDGGVGAVRAGAEVFVRLTADPDPEVRRAAAGAVVRFLAEPARALAVVRERLTAEREDGVLIGLVEALGLLARRRPSVAGQALDLLAAWSAPPSGPAVRLAALAALTSCAPERVPPDLVPTVLRLLRERSARRTRVPLGPGRPDGDSLVHRLHGPHSSDEEGARLLRTLHAALDDRLTERATLLEGQLTCPDPADRCNAVWMAGALIREWRGDHTVTVTLLGEQLVGEEGRSRHAAVSVLRTLFALAAPAADHLYALVSARPDDWVQPRRGPGAVLGAPLDALARTGDTRTLPVLAEVLSAPEPPRDVGSAVLCLGRAGAPLVPALRRALGRVPLDRPGAVQRAAPLVRALGALGAAEAVPELVRLLEGGAGPGAVLTEVALEALEGIGPPARDDALPAIRAALGGEHAGAAAAALWAVEADASAVLPVLCAELGADDARRRTLAARRLARLGPAAGAALPSLRRRAVDGYAARGGRFVRDERDAEECTALVCAVCAISGGTEEVARPLRDLWTAHPPVRRAVAACLAGLGPAAAPLRDLAATELTRLRRHTARPPGHGSHDIPRDEELLRLCREAVAAA
ncbi:HEAT repeat domain-containing protein [Streptomyces galbus]|uniref:HEAT repeat domain-containing protein n=1 Tax=Streptomyces galbus TaxID=33898 RepID=UPI003794A42E